MKISLKLAMVVGVLVGVLAMDGAVSLRQIARVRAEFNGVVGRDIVLMQAAMTVTRHQLEKAVVFERVRRVAEELAFQKPVPARREHLLFHIKLARSNLANLARDGALSIVSAKTLTAEALRTARDPEVRSRLEKVAARLREIERSHILYDERIERIFQMFDAGTFDISAEIVDQVHRDERKLSGELESLVRRVEDFTRFSLSNAARYERMAGTTLMVFLPASVLVGALLLLWILGGIHRPLKVLVDAAHRIGAGNMDVDIKISTHDEFGEVGGAFNRMAGRLRETLASLEDQRKELEENLEITRGQKQDLEKVNMELDRFVQTVSHDIRSPLMGVVWYADFLKNHYMDRLDQKGKDGLEGVIRSVERANALIRDLLALTRLSRVRNPYTPIQIGALLDEVIASLDYRIRERKADVRVQGAMPLIMCDGIKVKEVFLNLMTNALKFSPGDERPPVIEIEYRERPEQHEFVVRDNGIGIPPESYEEIFGMFKRLDTSDRFEGTGAGLSIVKSVVEDHGGRVWVESVLGQGAAFHFTIPKRLATGKPGLR